MSHEPPDNAHILLLRAADAAVAWWKFRKPVGWSVDRHLKTPCVNWVRWTPFTFRIFILTTTTKHFSGSICRSGGAHQFSVVSNLSRSNSAKMALPPLAMRLGIIVLIAFHFVSYPTPPTALHSIPP